MLVLPEIEELLKGYVHARLWTNRRAPEHRDADKANAKIQKERFKLKYIPWYVVLKPDGTEAGKVDGELDPAAFARLLKSGLGQ